MENQTRKKLLRQITNAAGNVVYTYGAHWNMVNRLKATQIGIKITQIVLTASSTGGFLASLIAGIPWLSWLGGFTSAIALALNLYTLKFNLSEDIKSHKEAANELWDVRESFKSLIVDFDDLPIEEIRARRDAITELISHINKTYPGTDKRSFKKLQRNLGNYMFADGESAKVLGVEE